MGDCYEHHACSRGEAQTIIHFEERSASDAADNLFCGCVLSVIAEHLMDSYLCLKIGKQVWDTLDAQYGVFSVGSELYIMERLPDYRIVEDHPMVEQAHEIHMLSEDLRCCTKENSFVLPDKFVAEGIISKLAPSWKDFATSLNYKRHDFTIDGGSLIGTLDVEEKAREKDK